jgi:hypothetical protein
MLKIYAVGALGLFTIVAFLFGGRGDTSWIGTGVAAVAALLILAAGWGMARIVGDPEPDAHDEFWWSRR